MRRFLKILREKIDANIGHYSTQDTALLVILRAAIDEYEATDYQGDQGDETETSVTTHGLATS